MYCFNCVFFLIVTNKPLWLVDAKEQKSYYSISKLRG